MQPKVVALQSFAMVAPMEKGTLISTTKGSNVSVGIAEAMEKNAPLTQWSHMLSHATSTAAHLLSQYGGPVG